MKDKNKKLQKKFGRKYFSSGSYKEYKREIARWMPKVARKINRIIGGSMATVLDVGCAQGYLLAKLQNKHDYSVQGIDFSEFAVKNAEPSVKEKIRQGSILNLPFEKNSFDAVISLDVVNYLESVSEVERAVRNLANVSKKFIFFGAIYKHAWTASQKWNPDKLRKSVLAKKDYIKFFEKNGAKLVQDFDGDNGGRILIFKKKK